LNVADALKALETREARLLLSAASGFSEASLIAYPERSLPPEVQDLFLSYVEKRKAGQPIAYILGRKEFYGISTAGSTASSSP
jgi:release factor glutamine methyltransferase